MTIFFCDIRSFTELSETMTPVENFNFINSYLKRINPIIRKNGGFIDKFIGDVVMAIFPKSPEDAVNAAIEMQKEIKNIMHIDIITVIVLFKLVLGLILVCS